MTALALPSIASADDSYSATDTDKDGSYSVKFVDDLLDARGLDASGPVISIRPVAVRTTLIRPRTSFVPQMLQSVEKI